MGRIIRKIKASSIKQLERKKVAAYVRVSPGKDAMLHSLSAQISYYNDYIQKKPEWEFVGIYTDEAMTGTKDNRAEFQITILASFAQEESRSVSENCKWQIRKSFSEGKLVNLRFMYGYNIDDGEMYIKEEEAKIVRSISENVTWGQRKRFADGKIKIPHIYEDKIKEMFTEVFNSLIEDKEEIIKGIIDI